MTFASRSRRRGSREQTDSNSLGADSFITSSFLLVIVPGYIVPTMRINGVRRGAVVMTLSVFSPYPRLGGEQRTPGTVPTRLLVGLDGRGLRPLAPLRALSRSLILEWSFWLIHLFARIAA